MRVQKKNNEEGGRKGAESEMADWIEGEGKGADLERLNWKRDAKLSEKNGHTSLREGASPTRGR